MKLKCLMRMFHALVLFAVAAASFTSAASTALNAPISENSTDFYTQLQLKNLVGVVNAAIKASYSQCFTVRYNPNDLEDQQQLKRIEAERDDFVRHVIDTFGTQLYHFTGKHLDAQQLEQFAWALGSLVGWRRQALALTDSTLIKATARKFFMSLICQQCQIFAGCEVPVHTLACGHAICTRCFNIFAESNCNSFAKSLEMFRCFVETCSKLVPRRTWSLMISADLKAMIRRAKKNFVFSDVNFIYKRCPHAQCNAFLRLKRSPADAQRSLKNFVAATCSGGGGHTFCFNCRSSTNHFPVPCSEVKKRRQQLRNAHWNSDHFLERPPFGCSLDCPACKRPAARMRVDSDVDDYFGRFVYPDGAIYGCRFCGYMFLNKRPEGVELQSGVHKHQTFVHNMFLRGRAMLEMCRLQPAAHNASIERHVAQLNGGYDHLLSVEGYFLIIKEKHYKAFAVPCIDTPLKIFMFLFESLLARYSNLLFVWMKRDQASNVTQNDDAEVFGAALREIIAVHAKFFKGKRRAIGNAFIGIGIRKRAILNADISLMPFEVLQRYLLRFFDVKPVGAASIVPPFSPSFEVSSPTKSPLQAMRVQLKKLYAARSAESLAPTIHAYHSIVDDKSYANALLHLANYSPEAAIDMLTQNFSRTIDQLGVVLVARLCASCKVLLGAENAVLAAFCGHRAACNDCIVDCAIRRLTENDAEMGECAENVPCFVPRCFGVVLARDILHFCTQISHEKRDALAAALLCRFEALSRADRTVFFCFPCKAPLSRAFPPAVASKATRNSSSAVSNRSPALMCAICSDVYALKVNGAFCSVKFLQNNIVSPLLFNTIKCPACLKPVLNNGAIFTCRCACSVMFCGRCGQKIVASVEADGHRCSDLVAHDVRMRALENRIASIVGNGACSANDSTLSAKDFSLSNAVICPKTEDSVEKRIWQLILQTKTVTEAFSALSTGTTVSSIESQFASSSKLLTQHQAAEILTKFVTCVETLFTLLLLDALPATSTQEVRARAFQQIDDFMGQIVSAAVKITATRQNESLLQTLQTLLEKFGSFAEFFGSLQSLPSALGSAAL